MLENAHVRLEPLQPEHGLMLHAAVGQTAAAQWLYMMKDPTTDFEGWLQWLLGLHERGAQQVYVVRDAAGAVVGCSSYLNHEKAHQRIEIGNTWYVPAAQGGKVNPATKLLLLEHAFGPLGCWRVELKCDARNLRSQAAMRKLGAVQEGTLRGHMTVPDHRGGSLQRDTVYFS
ncbi:MAG: N-acetyltransferase, partial [Proteobacteria bacterium]|nr:N-acetyltransferase [Pseudomonadota bacterium]